jgi:DNA polymerase III subunit epsilon
MNKTLNFTAFAFETAQETGWSICQVGLVIAENGIIKKEISRYIQPPGNKYLRSHSSIHGIDSEVTGKLPFFPEIWNEIKQYFDNSLVVADSDFDIDCLYQTLDYYKFEKPTISFDSTYKLTGLNLESLCSRLNINFKSRHDAILASIACAEAYIKINKGY